MARKQIESYKKSHQACEACGRPATGDPHHIRTRGAGGGDEPENLLRLCNECHYQIAHQKGIMILVLMYPHIEQKVLTAAPYLGLPQFQGEMQY